MRAQLDELIEKAGSDRDGQVRKLLDSAAAAGCHIGLGGARDSGEMSKAFTDLEEREILALAIALEEEDGRIYRDFAEKLKASYPEMASILE
jgi:Rubrerythrin